MRPSPTLPSQLFHIRLSTAPFVRSNSNFSLGRARILPARRVHLGLFSSNRVFSRNFATSRSIYYQAVGHTNKSVGLKTDQSSHFHSPRYSSVLSGVSFGLLCTFGAGLGLGFTLLYTLQSRKRKSASTGSLEVQVPTEDIDNMSAELLPGRPGNLTAEQEDKLRQLWQLVFQVCGVGEQKAGDEPDKLEKTPTGETKKSKKGRMGFLRRGKKDSDADSTLETEKGPTSPVVSLSHGEEDKHGQVKHFHETLSKQSPEFLRDTIWSMVKHDHPDALVLRFLRARKWDVEKALIMFISTINWRATDMKVDNDIMKTGEGAALAAQNGSDATAKLLGRDFLEQMRLGKSYLHGCDKLGRPICVVRARLHKAGEQVEESLERYTVYLIETTRMLLNPPIDTAVSTFTSPAPSYYIH